MIENITICQDSNHTGHVSQFVICPFSIDLNLMINDVNDNLQSLHRVMTSTVPELRTRSVRKRDGPILGFVGDI